MFIEISETEIQPPNYKAILAMWLVVNYKFMCSGPPELLLKVPKARFCEHAVSCIDMYEKELRKNLEKNAISHSTVADYSFIDILKPIFIWPSDLSCRHCVAEKN